MKKQVQKNKSSNFWAKTKDYFIISLIITLMVCVIFSISGCFPFGNNVAVMSDSSVQICRFLEYFYDVLSGKQSIFYTATLAGGVELIGTLGYMLLNPFYLIALLAGRSNIYNLMSFSVLAMFIFNGLIFNWFVKKHIKKIGLTLRIFFSLSFVFSTFVIFNYAFISWLILPAIMLLIVDGFFDMVNGGNIKRFIIYTIWYIVTSIASGISTTIILLAIFVGYVVFVREKEERKPILTKLFVAYLVSAIICVILFVPFIYCFVNTERTDAFYSILQLRVKDISVTVWPTALLLNAPVLLMVIYRIIKTRRGEIQDRFVNWLFICLTIVSVSDVSLKFISGGIYAGFANRYYFMLETLMFLMVLQFIEKRGDDFFETKQTTAGDDAKDYGKKYLKFVYVFLYALFLSFVFLYFMIQRGVGYKLSSPVNFSSKTFLLFLELFLIVTVLSVILLYLKAKRVAGKKFLKTILFGFLLMTLVSNSLIMGSYKDTTETEKLIDKVVLENCEGENVSALHMNFLNNNYHCVGSVDYFSSVFPNTNKLSFNSVGNKTYYNSVCSNNGTLLSSSLLGLNYVITQKEEDRPYLTLVANDENVYLYKNELATSGAITIDREFEFPQNSDSTWELYEKLKDFYEISGELYSEIEPTAVEDVDDINDSSFGFVKKVTYTSSFDGIMYYSFETKEIEFKNKSGNVVFEDCSKVFVDGSGSMIFDIGFIRAGEPVDVLFFSPVEQTSLPELKVQVLNYQVAEQICQKLKESQIEKKYKKAGYELSFTLAENERLVVFNVDNAGMVYSLDGASANACHVLGYFVSFTAEAGDHTLQASYHVPYLKTWIFIAIFGTIFVILILFLHKKIKNDILEQIISVAMVDVFWVILSILVVVGPILTIVEFII